MENYSSAIVLIPSYQPTSVISNLCRGLHEIGFHVLVIDDGSGSKFDAIFKQCEPFAEVLRYATNKGKGFALRYGIKHILDKVIAFNCLITADGDGQHLIHDIIRIYEKCKNTNHIIIGDRTFDVRVPLKSRIGNGMSKFAQALYTYRYLHDNQCGLRAFPLKELPYLLSVKGNRYEYEMNVITFLQLKEIPYETLSVQTIYEDNNKGTHFRPIKDTLRIQGSLLLLDIPNIIAIISNFVLALMLYLFVFKGNIVIDYETATLCGFVGASIVRILLNIIIFKPRYPAKTVLRTIIYQAIIFVSTLVTVSLFTRVFHLHMLLSYFIAHLLIFVPVYYAIKGVGVVYESQRQ